MPLRLYNTLIRKKETFQPKFPEKVSLYVCGPTVYNYAHIGNARPAVVFDLLYRLLSRLYPKVIYARNITDIDDKIIAKAHEEGKQVSEISSRYYTAYQKDMESLHVLEPSLEPRATAHIQEMIEMIQALINKKYAYEIEGHVLFHVPSFASYGTLSGRNREEMKAGARVEVAPYKKDPSDFVLWKPSKEHQPGWDSPWGLGRPGWHIECSAMIRALFGEDVDIHGGGQDLIFPHHENEMAQSICSHQAQIPCARFWMHNGFVRVSEEKMSKSLGNVILLRDMIQEYSAEAVRLALLSAHYRSPLDWNPDLLRQSRANLNRFYECLQHLENVSVSEEKLKNAYLYSCNRNRNGKQNSSYHDLGNSHDLGDFYDLNDFIEALEDDLNVSLALSVMHRIVRKAHLSTSEEEKSSCKIQLLQCADLLGILQNRPHEWFHSSSQNLSISSEEIDDLIREREDARLQKNFTKADQIRDRLSEAGITLKDGSQGTEWRKSSTHS